MLKACIIDLDGTIHRNFHLIEGANEAIQQIKALGLKVLYLSNRGNVSRKMCADQLKAAGFICEEEEFILASTVAAYYLSNQQQNRTWLLSDRGLKEELTQFHVPLATNVKEADWLLIALHEHLVYEDLNNAFKAVMNGAKIAVTNDDLIYPREDGNAIDVGGLIAAITTTTKTQVTCNFGKPSTYMRDAALKFLNVAAEECIVIGDGLATDMQLALQNNMKSAFVLSGGHNLNDLKNAEIKPDLIGENILDIANFLQRDLLK